MVSRIVYDPEDDATSESMSEMARSIHVQHQRAADPRRRPEERERAGVFADRLSRIHRLHENGYIEVVDMTAPELDLYGRLTDRGHTGGFCLVFPLDDGEAASLAIAVGRGWVLATDDGDALKALGKIGRRHPYQRVRKILVDAAGQGLIIRQEANAIHARMRDFGFWDRTVPFPETNR